MSTIGDDERRNPYLAPRAGCLQNEVSAVVPKLRRALALIAASALVALGSMVVDLTATQILESCPRSLLLSALSRITSFAGVVLEFLALMLLAGTLEGTRKRSARALAASIPAAFFLPNLLTMLDPPYAVIIFATVLFLARWAAVLPVVGWSLDTAERPRDRGSHLAWACLVVALAAKLLEVVLALVDADVDTKWALVLFVGSYALSLGAVARHAMNVRRLVSAPAEPFPRSR